jgi:acetyltransferase-like isoleucine patch superfamily enzyme
VTGIRVAAGWGADADADVLLGYRPDRAVVPALALGPGARLRSGTVLYDGSRIGDRLQTGHHVVIREQCDIGDDVSVWSSSVIDYGCHIGDRVRIHSHCYVAQFTRIDDDAFLAPGVTFANDLYPGSSDSARAMTGPVVGAGAQLGVNVTVLPYVRLGAGCLVGAGSVVTRDVAPGAVVYGNPAVVRGHVDDLVDIGTRVTPDASSLSGYRARSRTEAGRQ